MGVTTLAAEVDSDPAASDRGREAAQMRAAAERTSQVSKVP